VSILLHVLYNLHASLTSIDRTDYSDSLLKGGG
jgi:hypothetical protein